MRERAELYLGNEPVDAIITKRNEAISRVDKLNREIDELELKAKSVRAGQD